MFIKLLDVYLFEMQMKGYYEPEETWEDFVKKNKFDFFDIEELADFITFKSGSQTPFLYGTQK